MSSASCIKTEQKAGTRHPWHLRHIRGLVFGGSVIAIIIVSVSCVSDGGFVQAREVFGIFALALLLAAMVPGPLAFVLPWLPLRGHLVLARRALGVSSFAFGVCHVTAYVGPTVYKDWRLILAPGKSWIAGVLLGIPLLATMAALAFTSSNRAVRRLGPAKWKKLHKAVYVLVPLIFVHAIFLGADFGVNKGPDVTAEPDAGSLIGMLIFAGSWLTLFILRKRRVRWTPAVFVKKKDSI